MKKVIIVGIIILAIITIYDILSLYTGIYIDFKHYKEIDYLVYTQNGKLYFKDNNEEFIIKGVEIKSSYPGYNFSDYTIDKNTYLRWLNEISAMGANTIKLPNRFAPTFYEAFYEFNKNTDKPIYLIQCIDIEEYLTNNSESVYGFRDVLLRDALSTVDAIHGNRYIITNGIFGKGLYNTDVSKWTLGYIISNIGKDETIAYTDNTDVRIKERGYNGKYFYTKISEASETECIIAELMDKIINYETNKYSEQKLISVMMDQLKDPFQYKDNINIQLGKMAYVNINHIIAKSGLKTGIIISYDMDNIVDEFLTILKEEEKEKYKQIIEDIDENSIYEGYVDFINKYYNSPVLVAKYGFSTSRITDKQGGKIYTEEDQGKEIVNNYNNFIKSGSCGGIISSWQDDWEVTDWNVKYSTEENKEIYWHNKEAIAQNRGLLKFEIADNGRICYVDGNIEEWRSDNIVNTQDGMELYYNYDYENLYIMVNNISEQKLIIPLDITSKSGSNKYENITFSRPVDYIIMIDGKDNSEILVQEYYDSVRAMYEDNITGLRQFHNIPQKDSNIFKPIRVIQKRKIDVDIDISLMSAEDRIKYRFYKTANAGKLFHGNNNPNSTEYNSLTDFCIKENTIEIQIPWQLLNFSSPSELLIHDDYYKKYGVENQKIDSIFIGVGSLKTNKITLNSAKLDTWIRNVKVKEKNKKSYEIIKESWNK